MSRNILKSVSALHIASLPPLVWGATIAFGSHYVELVHGSSVNVTNEGYSEGAWAGEFTLENLLTSNYVVGSGGVISHGLLNIRTPSHTLERIWIVTAEECTYVSNSLPFVLCISGSDVDNRYPYYEADLLSFLLGSQKLKSKIPLKSSRYLSQYCDSTLKISSAGVEEVKANTHQIYPNNFHSYFDHLQSVSSNVALNAKSVLRSKIYSPLATVSKGYDSPACSVLAKYCGAESSITYSKARNGFSDDDDDGGEIAKILGLSSVALDRDKYRSNTELIETMFLASGGGGEDVILSSAQSHLNGSLLFTGFLGDTIWGLNGNPKRSKNGRIVFPGGGSLAEFRLNYDFIHLPLPILDLRSHESILNISNSDEMLPWRLGGTYDRPIPRRIAESSGVPREAFGRSKMAVTSPFYYDDMPSDRLSPVSKSNFFEYLEKNFYDLNTNKNILKNTIFEILIKIKQSIAWKTMRFPSMSKITDIMEPTLADKGRRRISKDLLLTHWAINSQTEKYRSSILHK